MTGSCTTLNYRSSPCPFVHLFGQRQTLILTAPDVRRQQRFMFPATKVLTLVHIQLPPSRQFLWKQRISSMSTGAVRLSEFIGFILMHFSRQTVPRDPVPASLPNLQQITIIPTHALQILMSFLWFQFTITEWSCCPCFMVTARWCCGFVISFKQETCNLTELPMSVLGWCALHAHSVELHERYEKTAWFLGPHMFFWTAGTCRDF